MSSLRILSLGTLVTILLMGTFPVVAQEPEPFRGEDEIFGRDFRYGRDAFLQRYSYDFRLSRRIAWYEDPQGFRATVGSISSDEFYVFEQVQKATPIRGPVYFEFRQQRAEDFDERYDRVLTGVGTRIGSTGWTATVLGDVVADKSVIDLQAEAAWRDDLGNRLRFAFIAVDVAQAKGEAFKYEHKPYTAFAEARLQLSERFSVRQWFNANMPLRREQADDGFDFTYWQASGGIEVFGQFSDDWSLRGGCEGVVTQRSRRVTTGLADDEQRFSRRHLTPAVEVTRKLDPKVSMRLGFRYFRLSERDRRPRTPALAHDLKRREFISWLGIDWQLKEGWVFWPTLFVDYVDNLESDPFDPTKPRDRDTAVISKVNFPLGIQWDEKTSLDFNLSMQLNEFKFGGGNVQAQIHF